MFLPITKQYESSDSIVMDILSAPEKSECLPSCPLLPPVIVPGPGRYKSIVQVALRAQSGCEGGTTLHWRFTMTPVGKENGPTVEGRSPARRESLFEFGYQFSHGLMGYRTSQWSGGRYNLEFSIPGVYRVFAWMTDNDTGRESRNQFSTFEIVP